MNSGYNPDFNPTGIEGGIDTNQLPWITLPQAPGMRLKPLRASTESGMFSVVVRLERGTELKGLVYLGAMDLFLLSGSMTYPSGPMAGTLEPGTWGYVPANARIDTLVANDDVEFLANYYCPVAFLGSDQRSVSSILTALDVLQGAREHGIALVPDTLAECMQPRPAAYSGAPAPLAIADSDSKGLVTRAEGVASTNSRLVHPHFVDTKTVPWIDNPEVPEMGLKLLSGHIGYRAGPPEGYGPGVWFYEPAGARHESTQRVTDEDLIYTANVYGPLQFDEGQGTPIAAVLSWMQYKEMADAAGVELVQNTSDGDASLLAWSPVGADAA